MCEINPFVNKTMFWHQSVCGLFAPLLLLKDGVIP